MCSARQPAMIAFAAMMNGVARRLPGWSMAISSCGSRSVYCRNASTSSTVGGITGSPSVHCHSRKYSLISRNVPVIRPASLPPVDADSLAGATGPVSASRIWRKVPCSSRSLIWGVDSMLNVPGYSATLMSGMPSCCPTTRASGRNPVAAIATEGMPAFSATMAGRTTAGVQVPQPPLPVINASHPFSSNALLTASNVFALRTGSSEAIVTAGNSLNEIILTVG